MPENQPTASTLRGPPPRLLLTLTIGSRVVRLTDGPPATVTRARTSDTSMRFDSGLTPIGGLERALSWFADSIPERKVSVSLLPTFNVAAMAAQGVDIYQASAEVAQHYDGQAWEQRRVLISGRVSEPVYGGLGETFAFSITESAGDDQAIIPAPTQRVTEETLPRLDADRPTAYTGANERIDPKINGCYYPIIIGQPGEGALLRIAGTVNTERTPAVPVLYVERTDSNVTVADHAILLAGHPIEATTCRLYNETDALVDTAATVHMGVDNLGQQFSYARPSANNRIPVSESIEVYASFTAATGGGMSNPFGTGLLRRADHVILWAMSQSTVRWDLSQAPRLASLAAFQIDGFINTPTSPWEWLRKEILSLLPVSVVGGPDGVYVLPWQTEATSDNAVEALEVGRNCRRISPVSRTSTSEVRNAFSIEFGKSARTGTYTQWRALTGARNAAMLESGYTASDLWCGRSQAVFGARSDAIQTDWTSDGATAELILAGKARAKSFPRYMTGVELPRTMDWLRPGDVVTLTDSSRSLSSQVAHVEGLSMSGGALGAALTWWEPMRYAH